MRAARLALLATLTVGGIAVAACPASAQAGPGADPRPGWTDPPARPAARPARDPAAGGAPFSGDGPAAQPGERAGPAAEATPVRTPATTGPADRLARKPTATPAREAGPPPAARPDDLAAAARRLAAAYLALTSAPGSAMVTGAPRFYGQRLRFHGRTVTLAALLAEKRRFARRWPERRYVPRAARAACAGERVCVVRTVHTFRAASPARGALSRGVAELVLTVSFSGSRPVIVAESSRVLQRGGQAAAAGGG